MKKLLILLLLLSFAVAQEAKKPTPATSTPILSEVQTLRLIATYQRYMMAQKDFETAQARLESVKSEANSTTEKIKSEAGFPKEATFTVNIDAGTVIPNLPKPEEKKEKKRDSQTPSCSAVQPPN